MISVRVISRTACLAILWLSGCASDVVSTCQPVRYWTPEEQDHLYIAVHNLDDHSPIIAAMEDYASMRAAAKACQADQ